MEHIYKYIMSFVSWTGESDFFHLLDIWFPDKKPLPTAFLVDTSEEALLLPDWLKLRMIRSEVSRLVDAGTSSHWPKNLFHIFFSHTICHGLMHFFFNSSPGPGTSAAAAVCAVVRYPCIKHEQTAAVLGPGRFP